MTFEVLKVATNGDPVATQEPKGPGEIRGVNLNEKRMRRKNHGDAEERGHNCAVCGRRCAKQLGLLPTAVAPITSNWHTTVEPKPARPSTRKAFEYLSNHFTSKQFF